MSTDPALRGSPRRWYLIPFVLGLALMTLAVLVVKYPILLVIAVAVPLFLAGLGLMLWGLDLWRSLPEWTERIHPARFTAAWRSDEPQSHDETTDDQP